MPDRPKKENKARPLEFGKTRVEDLEGICVGGEVKEEEDIRRQRGKAISPEEGDAQQLWHIAVRQTFAILFVSFLDSN